ncbi:MAG: crossover junction endodeoxyribonuclease RuvC [Solirubrobacterales bacterium]
MKVVMGIDPGTANFGFGVVRVEGSHLAPLDGGVIETASVLSPEKRLEAIHRDLSELIDWHRPTALAVEELFFGTNADSAMRVGQAVGVALLCAAQAGIECFSYTPQVIKKAVCGSGGADKKQVQRMVATLLGLNEVPKPDHAADALAVAICHAGTTSFGAAAEAAAGSGSKLRVAS